MKFRSISLLVLLWISTMIWAPTCGGGPTGTVYYIDNIGSLGLPVVTSSDHVVDILNATDNSSIVDGLIYRCQSESSCQLYSFREYPKLGDSARVLLVVNNSGSVSGYYADLRYNGSGGMANCGGAAFVIENIKPANDSYLILAALVLIAAAIAGFFILKNYFKKNKGKSQRGLRK